MKHRVLVNGLCLACLLLAGMCGSLRPGINLNVDGTLTRSFTSIREDPGKSSSRTRATGERGRSFSGYLHYADGRTLFQKTGTVKRSNASWINLTPNKAVIPAKDP